MILPVTRGIQNRGGGSEVSHDRRQTALWRQRFLNGRHPGTAGAWMGRVMSSVVLSLRVIDRFRLRARTRQVGGLRRLSTRSGRCSSRLVTRKQSLRPTIR